MSDEIVKSVPSRITLPSSGRALTCGIRRLLISSTKKQLIKLLSTEPKMEGMKYLMDQGCQKKIPRIRFKHSRLTSHDNPEHVV